MRFRPRSHPYAALAEADHHADASTNGLGINGGESELSRLLLLGGVGGGRMLPHCSSSGGEDTEADTARGNKEEERPEDDQEGRDDDGGSGAGNNNALPDQKTKEDPFLLRSDPFGLLPPSHPCNHHSHSNRNRNHHSHSNRQSNSNILSP